MFDPALEIAYRTTIEVPRTGPVGKALRHLADHPILGGLLSGVIVVIIAAIARPGGVTSQPGAAAIISAMVIVTWMILFFIMRGFFKAQSMAHIKVLRQLFVDSDRARWLQQKEPIKEFNNPRLRILTNPVPDRISAGEHVGNRKPTPWPVWIVIDSTDEDEDQRIIFETRDAARRASEYGEIDDDIMNNTDEKLPRAIAAPILQQMGN